VAIVEENGLNIIVDIENRRNVRFE